MGNLGIHRLVSRSMVSLVPETHERPSFALAYAWAGFGIMWCFWVCFLIFLAEPRQVVSWWPLPTVDGAASLYPPVLAALIDLLLIALFGLQHSVMARTWFKRRVMGRVPPPLERVTYVHMANASLFTLILCWQPIPVEIWNVQEDLARDLVWCLFAAGWIIFFLGAWSFGIRDLLGIEQVTAWREGRLQTRTLKTGLLYRWLRHPMYVGVLMSIWATPRMSFGHLLLALALTGYVLIAMRYEERDLLHQFGGRYRRWRRAA
jgi:protein-S-isoprenylcysteine O-methyltransferase Ste14